MTTQQQQKPANQLALTGPRLAYHPALQERFNIDKADWGALIDAVFPTAQTAGAVILALSYCRARRLDVFKKVVHIVPIWDKERKCYVETVWPGIAEHRTTAARTKLYAGHDPVQHGPTIEQEWQDGDQVIRVRFPEWAQMTVYRMVEGQRCAFPGPQVYWLETYASKKNDAPNQMWKDRPFGMIDKCAEAAALRGAFPEEIGDEPTEVEASGRNWHGRPAIDVTPQTTAAGSRADAVLPAPAPGAESYEPAPIDQERPGDPHDVASDAGQRKPRKARSEQPEPTAAEPVDDSAGDVFPVDDYVRSFLANIPKTTWQKDRREAQDALLNVAEKIGEANYEKCKQAMIAANWIVD